ncbi:hypothetical protein JCM10212_002211 [Sporobolomyces blumeae]
MESYLDGLPRSASTSSIASLTVDRSPPSCRPSSSSSNVEPSSTTSSSLVASSSSSSFWSGGISQVWSGLKRAAKSEVQGFLNAFSEGVDPLTWPGSTTATTNEVGQEDEEVGHGMNRDGKRARMGGWSAEESERHQGPEKRRKVDDDDREDSRAIDRVVRPSTSPDPTLSIATPSSSISPETYRRALVRPYATETSYDEHLMYTGDEAGSTGSIGGLRSLSGKRRLDVFDRVGDERLTATTSAVASSRGSTCTRRGLGGRSDPFQFLPPNSTLSVSRSTSSELVSTPYSRAGLRHVRSPRLTDSSLDSRRASRDRGDDNDIAQEQVGNMLLGSTGQAVDRVWREAKDKDKTRKISELENEVKRLKGELSTRPSSAAPSSTSKPSVKSPRRSAPSSLIGPTPPVAPPPPPVGFRSRIPPSHTHPVLFSARASLRATPPRPGMTMTASSTSTKTTDPNAPKRRASAIGGVGDMGAFLGELGEKRAKLRKVGLPKDKGLGVNKFKKDPGELSEVLQRALARKFAKSHGLGSPSFESPSNPRASGPSSSICPEAPPWSSSKSLSVGGDRAARPVPPQPVFRSALTATDTASTTPRKLRSTSLVSTETTLFGRAVSTDVPVPSSSSSPTSTSTLTSTSIVLVATTRPRSHTSSSQEAPRALHPIGAWSSLSPSLSSTSLPSAPPEPVAAPAPTTFPASSSLNAIALSSLDRSISRTGKASSTLPIALAPEPSDLPPTRRSVDDNGCSASERLSSARKRTSATPLPGLDATTKRAGTPSRRPRSRKSSSTHSTPSEDVVSGKGSGSTTTSSPWGEPVEGDLAASKSPNEGLARATASHDKDDDDDDDDDDVLIVESRTPS